LQASGEYDFYGAPRGTQTGSFTTNHRFVGQLGHTTDAETGGLIYMQARYCDPTTGRFVSEDPGRNGENWYGYCASDPVNAIDKDGKHWEWYEWLAWGLATLVAIIGVALLLPAELAVGAIVGIITLDVIGDLAFCAIGIGIWKAYKAWKSGTLWTAMTERAQMEASSISAPAVSALYAYETICDAALAICDLPADT
jgi:RHS repeat-associated protein